MLQPFLDLPFPSVVKHVLPEPLFFPRAELLQLVLSPEERQVFSKHCPNVSTMLLGRNTAAPTPLHSWGSQATGCHCLCRSYGFSESTLSEKGIYGIAIPLGLHEVGSHLDLQGFPAVRHPHPTEVTQVCPNALLDNFRAEVLRAAKHTPVTTAVPSVSEVCQCPVPPAPVPVSPLVTPWFGLSHQGAASACSVWFDGLLHSVSLSSLSLTVDHLLQAHSQLCPDVALTCYDCFDGQVAPGDASLNGRCFALCLAEPLETVPPNLCLMSPRHCLGLKTLMA